MSYTHLSSNERYVISHLVLYGLSLREIGQRLNRHHTTISREIKRNRPTYTVLFMVRLQFEFTNNTKQPSSSLGSRHIFVTFIVFDNLRFRRELL